MDIELINKYLSLAVPYAICAYFTIFIFLNKDKDKVKEINAGLIFFILVQLLILISLYQKSFDFPIISHIIRAWENAVR